jgi:hypothetical protein
MSFHSISCNAFVLGVQVSQRSPKTPSNTILSTNNGPAIATSHFLQLPNDGPAHFKQTFVPTTTASTGLQAYNDHQSILNDVTETTLWHQFFDNTLSHRQIMNVSNITFVPTLNALLTSSYLHPAGGMVAHTDATLTSLLLFHVNNSPAIMTKIHNPSLLLFFYPISSANTTALNAPRLPLLYIHDNPAIMMATHTNLMLLYVCNDPAIITATHASLLLC